MSKTLQESESRLSAIFNTSVDGIITISRRGIVESMNPAAAKMFGYHPNEVIGNNIKMLMPEPDRSQHDGYIENYQTSRKPQIIGIGREVIGLKKDGTKLPFRLSVSEVKLKDEVIYTGIIHDISEQKEIESKLQELNEHLEQKVNERTNELAEVIDELQHTNKNMESEIVKRKEAEEKMKQALAKEVELGELKSRFVSMASHEFRTPLGGILSSVALIGRYNKPEQQAHREKHIGRIKVLVHNLTGILNDFLSLDKLQAGKITCNPIRLDLLKFTNEVVEEMQSVKKTNQTIVYQHEGKESIVFIDDHILRNILINLISNAIKYSDEGKPINIHSEIKGDQLSIKVSDQGMGIPEEDKKHMFERFFRAKNAINTQGTGLGLNIVQRYLEFMGGEIEFESAENKGTIFTLYLPKEIKENTKA